MMSTLRLRVFSNAKNFASNGVTTGPKAITRNFAKFKEPPNMVQDEEIDYGCGDDINVPWLRNSTRVEMYKKMRESPKLWSAKNLAIHYKVSAVRTNAVISLMARREEAILSMGFKFDFRTGEPYVPSKWAEVYAHHEANKELNFAELATACDMDGQGGEVKEIVERMRWHIGNLDDLKDGEVEMEELMEDLIETGIEKASEFKETIGTLNDRWNYAYYPKMLRDEDVEMETARLMKNIVDETKAKHIKDFYYYVKKHSLPNQDHHVEKTSAIVDTFNPTDGSEPKDIPPNYTKEYKISTWNAENTAIKPVHDHSTVTNWRRTKLAFRDLSYQNYSGASGNIKEEKVFDPHKLAERQFTKAPPLGKQDRHEFACPPPTMILTRGKVWRRANAYEESMRSWTQHPSQRDLSSPLNKERVAYLKADWDSDEALALAQEKVKNDKRKSLFAAAGIQMKGGKK